MRIQLQPAYILHQRPYHETSLLIDFFTQDHGRITLVARGVRKEKSKMRAILQCFVPLLISFSGKTELMTLTSAEPHLSPLRLAGECLLSGLYLNELLMRMLQKHDPYSVLYYAYEKTLSLLVGQQIEPVWLRLFEKKLLEEIGYALPFQTDVNLQNNQYYHYYPDLGFQESPFIDKHPAVFLGAHLRAIATDQFSSHVILADAKRLLRLAINHLLGDYQMQSRKLFLSNIITEVKHA
jgi:DNA repair protein RecO (recombination protein O)